jgi:hypothetical protein
MRPYLKIHTHTEQARGVAQVVECLPSNHEVLSSNSSTAKIKGGGGAEGIPLLEEGRKTYCVLEIRAPER